MRRWILALVALGALVAVGAAAWWLLRPGVARPVIDRVELHGDDAAFLREIGDELQLGWRVRLGPSADPNYAVADVRCALEATPGKHHARVQVSTGQERLIGAPSRSELVVQVAETIVGELASEGALDPTRADLAAAGSRDPTAWRYWRRARRAREKGQLDRARRLAADAIALEPGLVMAYLELAASHQRGEPAGSLAAAKAAAGARLLGPEFQAEIAAWSAYYRGLAGRP